MAKEFIKASLDGAKELEKALDQLPRAMGKGVLRNAAKKALEPVKEAAEANAQSNVGVVTGRYSKSFVINTSLTKRQKAAARKSGGTGDVDVYVGSTDRKAHLLEFGTIYMPAKPVLRPAWEENKDDVLKIYTRQLAEQLLKAVRRLANKAIKGKLSAKEQAALNSK